MFEGNNFLSFFGKTETTDIRGLALLVPKLPQETEALNGEFAGILNLLLQAKMNSGEGPMEAFSLAKKADGKGISNAVKSTPPELKKFANDVATSWSGMKIEIPEQRSDKPNKEDKKPLPGDMIVPALQFIPLAAVDNPIAGAGFSSEGKSPEPVAQVGLQENSPGSIEKPEGYVIRQIVIPAGALLSGTQDLSGPREGEVSGYILYQSDSIEVEGVELPKDISIPAPSMEIAAQNGFEPADDIQARPLADGAKPLLAQSFTISLEQLQGLFQENVEPVNYNAETMKGFANHDTSNARAEVSDLLVMDLEEKNGELLLFPAKQVSSDAWGNSVEGNKISSMIPLASETDSQATLTSGGQVAQGNIHTFTPETDTPKGMIVSGEFDNEENIVRNQPLGEHVKNEEPTAEHRPLLKSVNVGQLQRLSSLLDKLNVQEVRVLVSPTGDKTVNMLSPVKGESVEISGMRAGNAVSGEPPSADPTAAVVEKQTTPVMATTAEEFVHSEGMGKVGQGEKPTQFSVPVSQALPVGEGQTQQVHVIHREPPADYQFRPVQEIQPETVERTVVQAKNTEPQAISKTDVPMIESSAENRETIVKSENLLRPVQQIQPETVEKPAQPMVARIPEETRIFEQTRPLNNRQQFQSNLSYQLGRGPFMGLSGETEPLKNVQGMMTSAENVAKPAESISRSVSGAVSEAPKPMQSAGLQAPAATNPEIISRQAEQPAQISTVKQQVQSAKELETAQTSDKNASAAQKQGEVVQSVSAKASVREIVGPRNSDPGSVVQRETPISRDSFLSRLNPFAQRAERQVMERRVEIPQRNGDNFPARSADRLERPSAYRERGTSIEQRTNDRNVTPERPTAPQTSASRPVERLESPNPRPEINQPATAAGSTEMRGASVSKVAPVSVAPQQVVQQIAEQTSAGHRQGISEMIVRIEPKELGPVRIRLQLEDGLIVARLQSGSGETREILQRNLQQLAHALREQGVPLQEVRINGNSSSTSGKNAGFERERAFAGEDKGHQQQNDSSPDQRREGQRRERMFSWWNQQQEDKPGL